MPYLEQVVKLAKDRRFIEAARACVDAFEAATSDEDHVILKYSRAMMLLLTKSVQNVEEGFKELQELLASDRMDWKSEFPAIYYGLGMYSLCSNWGFGSTLAKMICRVVPHHFLETFYDKY